MPNAFDVQTRLANAFFFLRKGFFFRRRTPGAARSGRAAGGQEQRTPFLTWVLMASQVLQDSHLRQTQPSRGLFSSMSLRGVLAMPYHCCQNCGMCLDISKVLVAGDGRRDRVYCANSQLDRACRGTRPRDADTAEIVFLEQGCTST